jgi:hypothetical protein
MISRYKPPGPARRGVGISFQPPKPTRLPSPWPCPTPGAKEIIDKLDELNKQLTAPVKRGRSKRRRKQQPKPEPKARVKTKLKPKARVNVRHQVILAALAHVYPDGKYENVGTTTLRHQAAPYWDEECKKKGVTYTLPGLDSFDRALGRR